MHQDHPNRQLPDFAEEIGGNEHFPDLEYEQFDATEIQYEAEPRADWKSGCVGLILAAIIGFGSGFAVAAAGAHFAAVYIGIESPFCALNQ